MLFKKIEDELKIAYKNNDSFLKDILSVLKSNIQYEAKKTGQEIKDELVIDVISKSVRKSKEVIALYETRGEMKLVEDEKKELIVLEKFLPDQLTEPEIKKVIQTKIRELNASGPKDMGRVMSEVMKHLKGKADGKQVNSLVRDILSG